MIPNLHNKIILIDEIEAKFNFKSIENLVQHSDCYFILITRRKLGSLSYSIKSIYKMETEQIAEKYITSLREVF